ncbi:MAG: hypothetical protein AAGJ08_12055 [Cyanobacteria bacterium P01_H01_bin.35]
MTQENGSSSWLSWCAAIASLAEVKAWRNHYLKYFKKASTINCLIGEVIEVVPDM